MNVRSLDVKMGVGELELNLRGKPQKDYSASVKGGVGDARILLPKDVGVIATATGGLGGVDTTGMTKEGNQYVNEAYKKSPVTIRLTIEGGVGGIKLLCE
jgi:predicted membrane protein